MPKYLISKPVGPLDRSLLSLKNFLSKVVSFGDADGFVNIELTQGVVFPNTCSLPEWWEKDPPDHFLFIHLDKKEEPIKQYLNKIDKEESFKHRELNKKLKDPSYKPTKEDSSIYDDHIYWSISCKATLIAQDSELPVRTGFWTRIVSESLDLAAEKTIDLWLKECSLPFKTKYKKYKHNFRKELQVILAQMHYDYTIATLSETLTEYNSSFHKKTKNLDRFIGSIDKVSAWTIFNNLKKTEDQIKFIRKILSKVLEDSRFKKFLLQEEAIEKTRKRDDSDFISYKVFKKEFSERRKRYSAFLKSLKTKIG